MDIDGTLIVESFIWADACSDYYDRSGRRPAFVRVAKGIQQVL